MSAEPERRAKDSPSLEQRLVRVRHGQVLALVRHAEGLADEAQHLPLKYVLLVELRVLGLAHEIRLALLLHVRIHGFHLLLIFDCVPLDILLCELPALQVVVRELRQIIRPEFEDSDKLHSDHPRIVAAAVHPHPAQRVVYVASVSDEHATALVEAVGDPLMHFVERPV